MIINVFFENSNTKKIWKVVEKKLYIWLYKKQKNMPVGIYEHKRKYPVVTGWWVYVHRTPDGMHYVGFSGCKEVYQRWKPKFYKDNDLFMSYISQYGWNNIEHIILMDGLTKEEALYWEDRLICMYTKLGCCLNKKRSGGNGRERYRKSNKYIEMYNNYNKQQHSTIEYKIYYRVHNYNRTHTPKETPLEAKQKYLQWDYIPDYIKSDDL